MLRSWRLDADPNAGEPVAAAANTDHRLLYLDYEGEVSGQRGHVTRLDAGTFEGELGDTWEVTWHGQQTGRAVMQVTEGKLTFQIHKASAASGKA